jgi:hypothetical protein
MTSTDLLIRDLSADLAPVQRRSVRREAGTLLVLGAVEFMLVVMVALLRHQAVVHHDVERGVPFMMWKFGSLAVLAGLASAVALRSFAPPAPVRRGLAFALGLVPAAMIAGLIVTSAADRGRPLIERLDPAHGLRCAVSIIVLAVPMMMLLARLMRRAAPVHPERSAWATGLAASACGALLFAVCCPMTDPLYVIVWYFAASAVVTAAARWLLPRRFRL